MKVAEFQRRDQGDADPWGYRSSAYERAEYGATLAGLRLRPFPRAARAWRLDRSLQPRLVPRCLAVTTIDFSHTAAVWHELRPYLHARADGRGPRCNSR